MPSYQQTSTNQNVVDCRGAIKNVPSYIRNEPAIFLQSPRRCSFERCIKRLHLPWNDTRTVREQNSGHGRQSNERMPDINLTMLTVVNNTPM